MPKEFANAQDLVAVSEIKDDVLVLAGGDMRQVVLVGGINFSLKSEEEQNILTQSYQNFLNGLSFPIQIVIHSRKINIESYLKNLNERKEAEQSGLLKDQITEYQEFIRSFVKDNPIMMKTFLVVVPYSPAPLPTKSQVLDVFSIFRKNPSQETEVKTAKENDFKEAKSQLSQRVSQVVEGLQVLGLETEVLNSEQLTELFYNFYNPETVERKKVGD